jgi:hypothetical protein
MVGSDMTPSLPLEQSLSGVVYSGSSASSWSKLESVARDLTRGLNGLGPVGPVDRSPPTLPGLGPKVKRGR